MRVIPETLYRAEQVRELDRLAIEDYGTPGSQLMERAGDAAFQAMRAERPRATKMLVLCGVGNNGGDGYVIARLGLQAGMEVLVLSLAAVDRLVGDALLMAQKYHAIKGRSEPYDNHDFSTYPLIVDAMLGTGFKGELRGVWEQAITALNLAQAAGVFVLSVDIPSGLNADTGHMATIAVQANLTVTFIGVKQGLLTADGPQMSGRLLFDDLAVDTRVYQKVSADVHRLDDRLVKQLLPRRVKNSNKGSFGKLLVVGSNPPYFGAARLSALAALRSGAGIVAIATRQQHAALMNLSCPEIICHAAENRSALAKILSNYSAIVIGPGLGADQWAEEMLATVLECELPVVIDADGLNGLARDPVAQANWIITPHPGEAARLLDCSTAEIQQDRFAAVRQLQQKYQANVVLKGCGTLLKTQTRGLELCHRGNPGMASAGMGDVLAGVLGGLWVQGLDIDTVTRLAVQIHAHAADLAVEADGERGLLATDLLPYIRRLVNVNR